MNAELPIHPGPAACDLARPNRAGGGLAAARMRRLAPVLLVAVLAGFFRFYRIDTVPPGIFFDEAQNGIDIAAIARGERFPVMVEAGEEVKGRTREPMYHYLAALAFRAFGPSATALRSTAAAIGTLTVIAFFLLARRMFGAGVALAAAVVLAACGWHVTLSRVGLRAVLVPLWIVLTVAAAARLAERRSRRSALLLGATFGLGWYTYLAYWIVPVPLVLLLAYHLFRTRLADLRHWAALAPTVLAAFLLVAAPIIAYAIVKPDYYFARTMEVTANLRRPATRWAELRDNLQQVFFMLHLRSRSPAQFGFRWQPVLDPLTGLAFLAGLYALAKREAPNRILDLGIVSYWLFPLLPGAVGSMPGSVLRSIGAAPAVCLIAGIGLARVAEATSGRRRAAAPLLLALALLAVVVTNYWRYFERWAKSEDVAAAFDVPTGRFFDYYAALAVENDVFLSPLIHHSPNLRFLALEHGTELRPLDGADAFVAPEGAARGRVYVSEFAPLNALIEEALPGAEVLVRYDVAGAHGGRVYRVAGEELPRSLSPSRRAELDYWLEAMRKDFHDKHRKW
jgi:hypothetical protein